MSNAAVTPPEVEGEVEGEVTAQPATSTADGLAAAMQALMDRGVTNLEPAADLDAEAILGACRWFDAPEQRRRGVGPGVLVMELKAGGKPGWQAKPRSIVDQQRDYGQQICDWINENFPDLRRQSGVPHPAAIAAVIRLHHRDGKGALRKSVHGREIREAVRTFNKRYGIEEN